MLFVAFHAKPLRPALRRSAATDDPKHYLHLHTNGYVAILALPSDSGTPESGGIAPLTFQKGVHGSGGLFDNSIISNFMVCHDRIETNLLQLFKHPENSQWFSIIYVIIFEINIVAEQKQAYW